jgi:hypothetical protein
MSLKSWHAGWKTVYNPCKYSFGRYGAVAFGYHRRMENSREVGTGIAVGCDTGGWFALFRSSTVIIATHNKGEEWMNDKSTSLL